ncbi:MAG: lipoyl(octanoyl) transferase LipB [Legionella sp.]|nr:lipoyl(octanoyl) transferase LipB [Legionella sp.]
MNIHCLGMQTYEDVWKKMKDFTMHRDEHSLDELWLLEHFPVYTQGQAGKPEHILNTQAIPVFQSDRGGQVTYHGPGQLVAYVLMDINRKAMGIKTLVCKLESTLIQVLDFFNIPATTQCGAPGVYVVGKKIASIGLRVKNGRTYHGIALNVNMDLTPFLGINPCGFSQLKMTQVADFKKNISIPEVIQCFVQAFLTEFKLGKTFETL